jgi:hypothetical protein
MAYQQLGYFYQNVLYSIIIINIKVSTRKGREVSGESIKHDT